MIRAELTPNKLRSVHRSAATLTKQLLAYSRKQVIAPRVLELNAAILNIEPILRRFIGKDIEFCTGIEPGCGTDQRRSRSN